jgi:uncharacterized protein (TIGR03435 family)
MRTTATVLTFATVIGGVTVVSAQAPSDQSGPAFEVASIKRNMSGSGSMSVRAPGDRFEMVNGTVMTLVLNAYGLQPFQVIDAPAWTRSERYDVSAKAESAPSVTERREMIRTLLRDRFKMVARAETRPLPAYVLMRIRPDGQLGPQLKPWTIDCATFGQSGAVAPVAPSSAATSAPPCGMQGGTDHFLAGGVKLDVLARSLSSTLETPVLDETGLSGSFEVVLRWARDDRPTGDAPSLFTAVQEQLGLKLEPRQMPVEVLVIDSVERPTPD